MVTLPEREKLQTEKKTNWKWLLNIRLSEVILRNSVSKLNLGTKCSWTWSKAGNLDGVHYIGFNVKRRGLEAVIIITIS